MALSQRIDLKLGQNLVMTPQLRQAIKLLELSHQELSSYIQSELDANPFLEKDEGGTGERQEEADSSQGIHAEDYEFQWRSQITLGEYVQEQINLDIPDPKERLIAQQLAQQLDENGYFTGDLAEIGNRLNLSNDRLETVLAKLQQMEPPGIFARNLAECLAVQLADKNRLDPLMQKLLQYLDLVGKKEYRQLRQILAIDEEDLMDMLTELRNLDPKPGLHFGSAPIQSIEPDILVSENPDGSWLVELNPSTLPRLIVNRDYRSRISANKEDKVYLSEKVAQANWLVRALDQRAQTILRVANEIVRRQGGFLKEGMSHFKPLLRRDIAAELNLHESTVSRVTANKFMATPKGTVALADFFGIGLGTDQASAKSVMYLIKEEVKAEKRPLSDEQLVKILKKKGIPIARRTVAKYRELMEIPSSAQRRKLQALSFAEAALNHKKNSGN